ncbi:MAG: SufE family protein [Tannerellaceae bacterium]|jgi:cysteine desulfuration protein SufE|nr:SufE family protein [Tannerellaceae bacterium]
MEKTINELQDEVIGEFEPLTQWMDRYALLIEIGATLPDFDDRYKTGNYLIEGCQSRVWLGAILEEGKVILRADSDALIVKGIVALLIRVLSGHKAQDILDAKLYFVDSIGLSEHLSPTRSNGLLAMIKQIRLYALAFKAMEG